MERNGGAQEDDAATSKQLLERNVGDTSREDEKTKNETMTSIHKDKEYEEEEEEEEEYVILDLDEVYHGAPVSANGSYTLSGLDTLSPILTLRDGVKLIGEYVEAIGTVLVYSEEEEVIAGEQVESGDFSTLIDAGAGRNKKKPVKKVQGVCKLERKLKFRALQTTEKVDNIHNTSQ